LTGHWTLFQVGDGHERLRVMWRRVALVRPWGLQRKAAHDHRRLRAERVHPPDRAHLRPYSPPTGSAAPSWLHARTTPLPNGSTTWWSQTPGRASSSTSAYGARASTGRGWSMTRCCRSRSRTAAPA